MLVHADGFIRIYAIGEGGRSLTLLHKTRVSWLHEHCSPVGHQQVFTWSFTEHGWLQQVDGIPGALVGFKGRLLAGIETTVRLYDMGKKKLLRKCEHRK